MKEFLKRLDEIAAEYDIPRETVREAGAKMYLEMILETILEKNATPAVNAPADDTPATPLPVQVFGEPVTVTPEADTPSQAPDTSAHVFEVGSVYATLKPNRESDGYFFCRHVKITFRTAAYVWYVDIDASTGQALSNAQEQRSKIRASDLHGGEYFDRGNTPRAPRYYASNKIEVQ